MTRAELKARAREQLGNNIFHNNWLMGVLVCFLLAAVCAAAGSIVPALGGLVVMGPLTCAVKRMFLTQSRDGQPMKLDDLLWGFTSDFGGTFLLGLMTTIFTFLWGLLFIIPGIVKAYSYSMSQYIKADNPEYDWQECIDASKEMMNGHKGELFILDLSFIGWFIVGALVAGVGSMWVDAYLEATRAQFYESIRGAAVIPTTGYTAE